MKTCAIKDCDNQANYIIKTFIIDRITGYKTPPEKSYFCDCCFPAAKIRVLEGISAFYGDTKYIAGHEVLKRKIS